MRRLKGILSIVLAVAFAFSIFSFDSNAMSATAEAHRRELTAGEIQTIHSIFNAKVYAKMYPDVVAELGEDEQVLFNHFITFGIWEQRQPSDAFNVDCYATRNLDLRQAFGDDIVAYYIYYATHQKEQAWRPVPTKWAALWANTTIYSVYDFVAGTGLPKEGAIPVQTPNYHPGVEINN